MALVSHGVARYEKKDSLLSLEQAGEIDLHWSFLGSAAGVGRTFDPSEEQFEVPV
jgi:hypothetical protein